MEQRGQLAASKMVESLTGWWELAGVDAYVGEEAVRWLELESRADAPPVAPVEIPSIAPAPSIEWPGDIETLRSMIAGGAELPCNAFGSKPVAPTGPASCEVMIVSDLTDQDELPSAMLGSGATGVLLKRMLAAIGIELSDCYWTALAMTIPPTSEVPESAFPVLAEFVRHQIALVKPKSLILLGSAACKAMLGEELMAARAQLRILNHDVGIMAALATFHPRTLIARPAMKAQAWKDLQMFAKRADL